MTSPDLIVIIVRSQAGNFGPAGQKGGKMHIKTTKQNKVISGIVAAMLLVLVLFSAFFLAAEAGHDCGHDDDCAICTCIKVCRAILKSIGGAVAVAAVAVLFVLTKNTEEVVADRHLAVSSLVSYKIRLND